MKAYSLFLIIIQCLVVNSAAAAAIDDFVGSWQVDYDATLKAMKTSPKYNPEKDARILPKILKKIADAMQLDISDTHVTFKMGESGNAMPYTVQSVDSGIVTLTGRTNDIDVVLKLQKRKKGRIALKSSMTDDMDYYVWKPAEKQKQEKNDRPDGEQ